MKSTTTLLLSIVALFYVSSVAAQKATNTAPVGPYTIRVSQPFKSPRKHIIKSPVGYGKDGIIAIEAKGCKSFAFEHFTNDLKRSRNRIVDTRNKFNEHTYYNRFVKLKDKTYLFVRDVNRDAHTEGISALEFFPKETNFANKSKMLFQSSGPIRIGSGSPMFKWNNSSIPGYQGYTTTTIGAPSLGNASSYNYNFVISKDKTKFLYTYSLVPKEKKDALNKDVIGMYVFDENLDKQWGGEFEMPYTEAKMDNLGYTVANDGKVYLLAKVYETDRPRETGKNQEPNFHFEILVYDKSNESKTNEPVKVTLTLDGNFPKEVYLYEDLQNNIAVAGFYSKAYYAPIQGAYLLKLKINNGIAEKTAGDFYNIPNNIIKSYVSDRERRQMEKKESRSSDGEIGVNNLRIRKIYDMPNGSTKIIAEQYVVTVYTYYTYSANGMSTSHTRYDTYAEDVFVFSIDAEGQQEWVVKIPKAQHSADQYGVDLSINSIAAGNDVHIFYLDNIKNLNLSIDQPPRFHESRKGGYLTAVKLDEKGNIEKYSLGEVKQYKTNFFINGFVDGQNNNLISTERRKRKNILFSIEENQK